MAKRLASRKPLKAKTGRTAARRKAPSRPPAVDRHAAARLRKILDINRKIISTLDLGQLLGIIMTTAADVMNAETASLMLLDDQTGELVFKVALGEKGSELVEKFRIRVGEGIAGYSAKTGESVIVNDPRNDKRFAIRFDDATGFSTRALICVAMRNSKGKIIGVLEALNPLGRPGFSDEDLDLFTVFADQATIAIENARLHREILRQEKARYELKVAHEIQQNFLPNLSEHSKLLDMAAKTVPARDVGGDFYDFIALGGGAAGIVIGDVSGKGVPAALYMVRAILDYRYLIQKNSGAAELVTALNNALARETSLGMFITLLYMRVDTRRGAIDYASAGHHPVLKRCAKTGQVTPLSNAGGVPVGLSEGAAYAAGTAEAAPGDLFVAYTDGVIEARNPSGKEYTVERLSKLLSAQADSAAAYTERVLEDLRTFTRDADQHDDLTLLALRVPERP